MEPGFLSLALSCHPDGTLNLASACVPLWQSGPQLDPPLPAPTWHLHEARLPQPPSSPATAAKLTVPHKSVWRAGPRLDRPLPAPLDDDGPRLPQPAGLAQEQPVVHAHTGGRAGGVLGGDLLLYCGWLCLSSGGRSSGARSQPAHARLMASMMDVHMLHSCRGVQKDGCHTRPPLTHPLTPPPHRHFSLQLVVDDVEVDAVFRRHCYAAHDVYEQRERFCLSGAAGAGAEGCRRLQRWGLSSRTGSQ